MIPRATVLHLRQRKPHDPRDDLMATRQAREANARFSQRYGEERGDVVREIELSVIGGDWGANGYTTIAQAGSGACAPVRTVGGGVDGYSS